MFAAVLATNLAHVHKESSVVLPRLVLLPFPKEGGDGALFLCLRMLTTLLRARFCLTPLVLVRLQQRAKAFENF